MSQDGIVVPLLMRCRETPQAPKYAPYPPFSCGRLRLVANVQLGQVQCATANGTRPRPPRERGAARGAEHYSPADDVDLRR